MYENIIQKHLNYIKENKDKLLEFEVRFEIEYSVYDILKKINSLQIYNVKKENSTVEYHGKDERRIIYSDKIVEEKKIENLSNVDKLQIQGFIIKIAVSEEKQTKIVIYEENPKIRERERYIIQNFYIKGAHLHLTRAKQEGKIHNSIEIEYDVNIIKTTNDILKPVKYIFDIMYVKSHELLTTDQSKKIINEFNNYVIKFKENRGLNINTRDIENKKNHKIINFDDKPISFEEKDISRVKTMDYFVTNKLNGVRYFIYIRNASEFYLIGKSSKKDKNIIDIDLVWYFSNIKIPEFTGDYILDGEYFNDKYYAFDILYHNNIVTNEHYKDRLLYLNSLAKYFSFHSFDQIEMKYIKYGIFTYEVVEYMKNNYDDWDHDNDGLIYTHIDSIYGDKKYKTLKWKFDHHQSLDVRIKSIPDNPNYYKCFVVDKNDEDIEINKAIKKKKKNNYILYSSIKYKDNDIVEISFDRIKKEFYPIRLRPDKINPNFITVAESFWKDIQNPIPLTLLCKKKLICDNNLCTWKNYRSYANKTIKTNIIKSIDQTHIIIDIGFGKGGDIDKYIDNGNKYIIAIEPDENNINEFLNIYIERLEQKNNIYTCSSKSNDKKIDISIISKSGSDESIIEDINKLLENHKNKITVCMFFSLTYFFNNEDDFVKLINNISKFKPERIVGTYMDGIKTINFINNYSYDKSNLELYFISKEKDEIKKERIMQKLGGFNNNVHISIPDSSTVKGHDENLVFFDNFESILIWFGYYLYKKTCFNFQSQTENCLLDYFSSLNFEFDFRLNRNIEINDKFINYIIKLNEKVGLSLYSNYFYRCVNNIKKKYEISYEELNEILIEMFSQNKNYIEKFIDDETGKENYFLMDENDDVIYDDLDINNKIHYVLTNSTNKNFILNYEIRINDILKNKLFEEISLKQYKINNILYKYYMTNENEIKECINFIKQYKSELHKNNIVEYISNIGRYTIHFTNLFNKVLVYEPDLLNYDITRHNVSLFYDKINYSFIISQYINVEFYNSNQIKIDENDTLFLNLKFIVNPYNFIEEIIHIKNEIIILSTNYLEKIEKYFNNFIVHKLINSYVYFINFQITNLELTPQYIIPSIDNEDEENQMIDEFIGNENQMIDEFEKKSYTPKSPDYPPPSSPIYIDNLGGVIKLEIEKIQSLFDDRNYKKDKINLENLRFTKESLYSITPFEEARKISDRIYKHFHEKNIKNVTVTDATANVGGNTISFYNHGINKINSVEIDSLTFEILRNNLKVYGYPINNVYCVDYLDIYLKLEQDCVFFDPPWGGPGYKKNNNLDLFLGEKNVVDIIIELFDKNRVKYVVLKAPTNFNETKLLHKLNIDIKYDMLRYNKKKNQSYKSYYVYYITGLKSIL
jgi:predicted RNA methylase